MRWLLILIAALLCPNAWAASCPGAVHNATPTIICDVTLTGSQNTVLAFLGGGEVNFNPPTWTAPNSQASFTASISGTTMTVTAVASGTLAVNQTVYGAGIGNGDAAVFDVTIAALGSGTGGTGTYILNIPQTVSSETVNSTQWIQIPNYDSGAYPGGIFAVWMIYGYNVPGTYTITEAATSTGGADSLNVTALPFTEASTDLIEYSYGFTNSFALGPGFTYPATSVGPNDTYLTAIFASPGATGGITPTVSCSPGYSEQQIADTDGLGYTAVCWQNGLSPGAQTNTFTHLTGPSITPSYFQMIMRPTLPTVGALQQGSCPLATTIINCPTLFPVTTGSKVIQWPACGVFGLPESLSNSGSYAQTLLPGHQYQMDQWPLVVTGGGILTMTNTCSSQVNPDFGYVEVAGTDPAGYADGVQNYDLTTQFIGGTSTAWNSTPVHLLEPGTYYLYCVARGATNQFVVPSTGWIPRWINPANNSAVNEIFDQIVTISAPTEFSCGQTWTTGYPGASSSLYAFKTTPYTKPQITQTLFHFDVATWFDTVNSGDVFVGCAQSTEPVTGAWTVPTQTCGGTTSFLQLCGTNDPACLFVTNGVTGGTGCQMEVKKANATHTLQTVADVRGVTAIQAGNSMVAGGGPVTTGNVTTTNLTTLMISCGNAGFDTQASFAVENDPTWSQNQIGNVDFAGSSLYSKILLTPGTDDNNFIFNTPLTYSAGLIVPLSLPPITVTQQPHVTIALNGKDIPAYQIGAQ